MMGLEFTGEIPFSDVYVHSIIQAPDGRRMSKSLGTGIDPLDLIEGGPRPPVFAGTGGRVPGLRRRRAALGAAGDVLGPGRPLQRGQARPGPAADQQALERRPADPARRRAGCAGRGQLAGDRRGPLDPVAAGARARPRSRPGSSATTSRTRRWRSTTSSTASCATGTSSWSSRGCGPASPSSRRTLLYVLTETVALAHPLIPFETEEIYSHIPGTEGLLAARVGSPAGAAVDERAEAEIGRVIEAVQALRDLARRGRGEGRRRSSPRGSPPTGYEETAEHVARLARLSLSNGRRRRRDRRQRAGPGRNGRDPRRGRGRPRRRAAQARRAPRASSSQRSSARSASSPTRASSPRRRRTWCRPSATSSSGCRRSWRRCDIVVGARGAP